MGSPAKAVDDGGPFRRIGWKFNGDPVESALIQFVQGGVKGGGIGSRRHWHLQGFELALRSAGETEINAVAFGRNGAVRQKQSGSWAVMFGVHARRGVSAFLCFGHD